LKLLYLIHQFYPEYYTGTEKFILHLATMMQKSGHNVKIVTYSFYKDSFYDASRKKILIKEFVYNGIPVIALKQKKIPEDIHYALENKNLSEVANELINRENPDVVHVGHSMRVGELIKALRPRNIPYLITLTDFFLICPKYTLLTSQNALCNGPEGGSACQNLCPEFPIDSIKRRLETARDILFNASAVISPSKFLAGILKKEFQNLDIKILGYGLRYGRLKRNEKKYMTGNKIVFCYAGSLNPHKGVHILVNAFKKIGSDRALLKIYGSGPDKSYVNNLLAMAKEDRGIEFCGVYSEEKVGEILSEADVIVAPSLWYENTPIVLREALACNVPAIASDVGGVAEDIKDGINGFLFKMGDAQHLKEVLQRVVNDPSLLNSLKHNISLMVIPGIEQEAYIYEREYIRICRR
jgi:glycosyltransferase involved in cell wall biosynthesis